MAPRDRPAIRTVELVTRIQREHGLLAHGASDRHRSGRDEIVALVARLVDAESRTIIPLRGDPPVGADNFAPPADAFAHASDLVAFIRQRYASAFAWPVRAIPKAIPSVATWRSICSTL